jgi:signal transduction histidine kinase
LNKNQFIDSGLNKLGLVPYGSHICSFYSNPNNFNKHISKFFRNGLENNEKCIWISSNIYDNEKVRNLLVDHIPDIEKTFKNENLIIESYKNVYFDENHQLLSQIPNGFIKYIEEVTEDTPIRLFSDLSWVGEEDFKNIMNLEISLNNITKDYKITVLCGYLLESYSRFELIQLSSVHDYVLLSDNNQFKIIQNYEKKLYEREKQLLGLISRGIIHDFKKIITIIKGYTDLVKSEIKENDTVLKYLKEIDRSIQNCEGIIGEFPKLSRKYSKKLEKLNVNNIINEITNTFSYFIMNKTILELDLQSNLPTITKNKNKIKQILMKLILNTKESIKEKGKIIIKSQGITIQKEDVKRIPNSREGKFVKISVIDTGRGMSEKTLNKLFEPFFTTKKEEGSGLGLSLVKIFIKEHKGWINVESKLNKGSKFHIYLPSILT